MTDPPQDRIYDHYLRNSSEDIGQIAETMAKSET